MSIDGVKKYSSPRGAKDRRIRAKERLEDQLKFGMKDERIYFENPNTKAWHSVKLTEADIKRIKKEIEILKTRI